MDEKNKKTIEIIFYICIFLILSTIFFKYILRYIFPFVLAYFFSLLLMPAKNFFCKTLKLSSGLSSVLTCLLFIFVTVIFSKTILSRAILEGKHFLLNLPEYIRNFSDKIMSVKQRYKNFLNIVPAQFRDNIAEYINQILNSSANKILKSGSGNVVKFIPEMFVNLIVTLMATFFLLKDGMQIKQFLDNYLPGKIVNLFSYIKKGCLRGLFAYIKSEMIMMCITGIICTFGYVIIKYPYALFLGMLTAFVDALPVLGTGFIIWPWIIYCFLMGAYNKAIILVITYVSAVTTRNILSPKLIGRQIGVHPLAMLIALYIGLKLFGFLGMIIGPIVIVIGKIIFEETYQN